VQRRPSLELLDTDSGTPKEVADSLIDLRWFNRWFGGIATTRSMIQTVARKTGRSEFSILEVAAGDGSLMQAVCASLQNSEIRLNVTLLDRALSHLPALANHNGNSSTRAGDTYQPSAFSNAVVADALSLPFPDSAFDLISSSLFVHHLSPDQATAFAHESLRVCRHAALVHDLVRHPLHLVFAYAGMPLYRSRLTRNDAPASVRQAYTIDEMKQFFRAAGAANVGARMHYFYRMGLIAWKGSGMPA
jgi:ubiquinone/menaquinone biosynthesis C-methylase UbiE